MLSSRNKGIAFVFLPFVEIYSLTTLNIIKYPLSLLGSHPVELVCQIHYLIFILLFMTYIAFLVLYCLNNLILPFFCLDFFHDQYSHFKYKTRKIHIFLKYYEKSLLLLMLSLPLLFFLKLLVPLP